jgi:uncharacterized spore protein YtfJ
MFDDVFRVIEELARKLQERFSVRTVYGDPITANGVTIVPVARVAFGFGGGGGSGRSGLPGSEEAGVEGALGEGGGGGGGGGGVVRPVGYVEITDGGSRWVPLESPRSEQLLRALVAALASPPVGGVRRLFVRLLAVAVARVLMERLGRPDLKAMLENLRFGRGAAEGEA